MSSTSKEKEVVAVRATDTGETEEIYAEDAGDMYAWSPIEYGAERDDDGNITGKKVLPMGEKASAGDLDLSDEQFEELVESGAVRPYPVPEDMPADYPGSPRDWMMDQYRLSEGHLAGGYFPPDVIEQLQFHADANEAREAAEADIAKHQEGKVVQKQPGAANEPKTAGATS